jgi:hypothetical protein
MEVMAGFTTYIVGTTSNESNQANNGDLTLESLIQNEISSSSNIFGRI